jgi:hypothetical protein
VDGRIGSEWILGRLAGGVEWIQLAEDRGRWRAVVTAGSGGMELVNMTFPARPFCQNIVRSL